MMNKSNDPNNTTVNPFQQTTRINRTPINIPPSSSNTLTSFSQPTAFNNEIYTSTPNRASVLRELLQYQEKALLDLSENQNPLIEEPNNEDNNDGDNVDNVDEEETGSSYADSEAELSSLHDPSDEEFQEELNDIEDSLLSPTKSHPKDSHIVAILSAENMAKFEIATFNRIIPEYKGDTESLNIFLRRCDTYHSSLTPKGKKMFLDNLIYKLVGRAFIIYDAKPPTDWKTLKADLSNGIGDKKSIATLQNELLALKQKPEQTATEFAEIIRNTLKKLTDKITELYDDDENVKQSFYTEHEKMAVRAFKEGLLPPLKYRVLNSHETSFEKVRQFALEEEPFTKKMSNNLSNTQSYSNQSKSPNISYNKAQNENPESSKDNESNRKYTQFNNMPRGNPFNQQTNPFRNTYNQPSRQYSYPPRQYTDNYHRQPNNYSQQPRPYGNNSNQQHPMNYNRQHQQFHSNNFYPTRNTAPYNAQENKLNIPIECTRCGKRGHTKDTCYVKLENFNKPHAAQDNDAPTNSFNQNPKNDFPQNQHNNTFNRRISIAKSMPKNKLADEEFGLPVQTINKRQ